MPWDWDWQTFLTVAALVQPGLLLLVGWAYRKYWVKGEIVIHPTSSIQVGYGPYGATVVLTGSLQAVNQEQFVAGMLVTITNEKTGEHHRFGWHAFISGHQRVVGGIPDSVLETPAGFMVTPQQGHRYTIDFVDEELEDEQIRPAIRRIEKEWSKGIADLRKWAMKAIDDPIQRDLVPGRYNAQASELFEALKKDDLYADVSRILERNCYWRAGSYRLQLDVSTSRPDATFAMVWRFELVQEEAEGVCQNVATTIAEVCQMPHEPYVFAYVDYKKVPPSTAAAAQRNVSESGR